MTLVSSPAPATALPLPGQRPPDTVRAHATPGAALRQANPQRPSRDDRPRRGLGEKRILKNRRKKTTHRTKSPQNTPKTTNNPPPQKQPFLPPTCFPHPACHTRVRAPAPCKAAASAHPATQRPYERPISRQVRDAAHISCGSTCTPLQCQAAHAQCENVHKTSSPPHARRVDRC